MAYSEQLAQRLRTLLKGRKVSERKMFGGLTFMLRGHMCCGVLGEDLVLRVGPESYPRALKQKHVRTMDFTGRAMTGMVMVGPEGHGSSQSLQKWVTQALKFTESLPPKRR